jgi:hypothetical protein
MEKAKNPVILSKTQGAGGQGAEENIWTNER